MARSSSSNSSKGLTLMAMVFFFLAGATLLRSQSSPSRRRALPRGADAERESGEREVPVTMGAGNAENVPIERIVVREPVRRILPRRRVPISRETTDPRTGLIHLNWASKLHLMALPGISRGDAQRIIAGRPYESKRDLLARKIIPEPLYRKIEHRLTV